MSEGYFSSGVNPAAKQNSCSSADLATLKLLRAKQAKVVNDHVNALLAMQRLHSQAIRDLQSTQLVALKALRTTQDVAIHALDSTHDVAHNLVNAEIVAFIRAHPECGSVSSDSPRVFVGQRSYLGGL
jgi:hypothetical protein